MKFYDKGFIIKYKNYTQVEILNGGNSLLKLSLYKDRVCRSTFECQNANSFNKEYLNKDYKENFLKDLFDKEDKEIIFRDTQNKILIKIIKD